MENDKTTTIRDFLYVDGDRLQSLYSQVFEGVAEQIIQSYIDELSTEHSQKGPPFQGSNVDTQVAEVTQRTENKVLYDHMYNRFEAKIQEMILEPPKISSENYREVLNDAFMVKIQGIAEIEDYDRIEQLLEQWNDLAAALVYMSDPEKLREVDEKIRVEEERLAKVKDKNKRAAGEKRLEEVKSERDKIVEGTSFGQDPKLMSSIRFFMNMFSSEIFSLVINPIESENVVFRGILDKSWLRVKPSFLRNLYGGRINWILTMVGQVTYLPVESQNLNKKKKNPANKDAGVRGAFQNIFDLFGDMEESLFENKSRTEIVVWPLAIYRETTHPHSKD